MKRFIVILMLAMLTGCAVNTKQYYSVSAVQHGIVENPDDFISSEEENVYTNVSGIVKDLDKSNSTFFICDSADNSVSMKCCFDNSEVMSCFYSSLKEGDHVSLTVMISASDEDFVLTVSEWIN